MPGKYTVSDNCDDVVRSLEFRFLIDRALVARRSGRYEASDVFIRAAQRLFETSLPDLAGDISLVASRKGIGVKVAERLAARMTPTAAAAVATIWLLRGARGPALGRLREAFADNEAFWHVLRRLCRRAGI